jgi:hypothetical protein
MFSSFCSSSFSPVLLFFFLLLLLLLLQGLIPHLPLGLYPTLIHGIENHLRRDLVRNLRSSSEEEEEIEIPKSRNSSRTLESA